MYLSKYYTCEEIDQRLLQGYYDDFVKAGFAGTIQEFWAFVLSIKDKVDKVPGYGLSKNDFTDELKAKLDGIEEHANYVTKVSQLANDMAYQTEDQVKKMISDLVDGADDALDTLKELAEALGNDPDFATNITNKLTQLRNELTEEINRAKEAETYLDNRITQLNNDITNTITELTNRFTATIRSINDRIAALEQKVDVDIADLAAYKTEIAQTVASVQAEAKAYTDAETNRAKEAEAALKQADHDLMVKHTQDVANLDSKITVEQQAREQGDKQITESLVAEQQARIQEDAAIRQEMQKADQEIKDNYVPWNNISTTELPNRRAITLKNLGDIILATGPDGRTYSMVQLNRWGVADFGNSSHPFNINTPAGVRPTVQEAGQSGDQAHEMAYLSDITKWFGQISIPEQYWDMAVIQLLPELEQSYVDDLGNPETVDGKPYDPTSNNYKIGDPYLVVAYFDEAFVMHYHLYSANVYYIGSVFQAMMDYATQNKKDHDQIREDVNASIGQINEAAAQLKKELENKIADEAALREAGDKDLDDRKVDKVEGYGLSKNDFTDELLQKLNGIEEGANKITAVSQLLNDLKFQTEDEVKASIEEIIGSAPDVLDTLEEIAKALGDDPNFATTITKKLAAITEDLNQEVEDREAADQEIRDEISKINTDQSGQLENLRKDLEQQIQVEKEARIAKDDDLKDRINSETNARANADELITNNLNTEVTNRQSADQHLQDQISELSRSFAEQGTSLINYVNSVRDSLQKGITDNTTLINTNSANIQRNLELIQGLQKQYNSLQETATSLQTKLDKEIEDRKAADANLQTQVDKVANDLAQEAAQRQAQDNILQQNIDNLKNESNQAIQDLTNKHNQDMAVEQAAREAADQAIQDKLDTVPTGIRTNEELTFDANQGTFNFTYWVKGPDGKFTQSALPNTVTIPAVTSTQAGVMTAADKNKLEKVIVDLATETSERKTADEQLQKNIDTLAKNHQDDVEALRKEIAEQDSDDVEWQDIPDENLPNRKAIILQKPGDIILGTDDTGTTFSIAQLSRWGIMDFGSASKPLNLNGKEDHPTYNDDEQLALISDIEKVQDIVVNFPVYGLKDQVYDQNTILGWFGVEDIPTLKRMIANNGQMYLKYGILLTGNPHYYRMPIQYAAFESATQIKLVSIGLDILNDIPTKYEIIINTNGAIIEGNSNVQMVKYPMVMMTDLEASNARIAKLEQQVAELIAALTLK